MGACHRLGEKMAADKFHVSKYNVRYGQPFGESQEDKSLIEQLRRGKIINPFLARPEGENSFGVYVGRRRFLAKKYLGTREFEVGKDCLIEDIDGDAAREASLIENLSILRKGVDPITRATALNQIMSFGGGGLRQTAARLGMAPSTLSEYVRVLSLSPKIQDVVRKGLLPFKGKGTCSALGIAKLEFGSIAEDELAELVINEGFEALAKELDRRTAGRKKRGIPKDVYDVVRITYNKKWRDDVQVYQKLESLAEAKGITLVEYVKSVLEDHIKSSL